MSAGGGTTLDYALYRDSARTLLWGSRTTASFGSPASITLSGGSPKTGTAVIYARLLSGQTAGAPGTYSSSFSGANTYAVMAPRSSSSCTSDQGGETMPSFQVLATPGANCIFTLSPLAFGTRAGTVQVHDASTPLGVRCTNSTAYSLALGNGQTGTGPTTRRMTNGANFLIYGLYQDLTRANPWGAAAGAVQGGTGTGAAQSFTIYGRTPSQPTPANGTYTDQVVVTATY
jgi:spore coat protein U-like protein